MAIVRRYAFAAQPDQQSAHVLATAVDAIGCVLRWWFFVALDHEVTLASSVIATKDFDQFVVDENIALAAV